MIEIIKYSENLKEQWNSFLNVSKNPSFLFDRNFMDYHSDRFNDYSLLAFIDANLVAILPANIDNGKLISHQGLSYGGLIFKNELRLSEIIEIIKAMLVYLNSNSIDRWFLKLIPRMYNLRPSDEVDWVLFKLAAKLYRRDTALVIDNNAKPIHYQERRKRSIKKALKLDINIKDGDSEFDPFWEQVLVPNLLSKHGVSPVHSIEEIKLLASRFPDNIKQYNIYIQTKIVAGCTIFLNKNVVHAQYISGSSEGRDSGCLDFLFDHLIKNEFSSYRYFDFGICNEKDGQFINKGLLDWKEGFGARSICHEFYEVETRNYNLLENILI